MVSRAFQGGTQNENEENQGNKEGKETRQTKESASGSFTKQDFAVTSVVTPDATPNVSNPSQRSDDDARGFYSCGRILRPEDVVVNDLNHPFVVLECRRDAR